MNIHRVNPVNNALDYWHRWKPYAHQCLEKDSHNDYWTTIIDEELYKFFVRIIDKIDPNKSLISYIKTSIKGIARRILERRDYKYLMSKYENSIEDLPVEPAESLDINLDDFMINSALEKYLNRLPKKYKEVLKMYFGISPYVKMTLKEIAAAYGLSITAIRLTKERALKRLKDILNKKGIYNMEDFIYG